LRQGVVLDESKQRNIDKVLLEHRDNISLLEVPTLGDVSSTLVRASCSNIDHIRALNENIIHPSVKEYIISHNLYSDL
jgi:nicotinic acid mononucleotide adenylyltransferase